MSSKVAGVLRFGHGNLDVANARRCRGAAPQVAKSEDRRSSGDKLGLETLVNSKVQRTFLRRIAWGVSLAALVVAVAALGWLLFREPRVANRVYRIGWQISPPYQIDNNGAPTGLAVDLVRQAARRRGIRLQWIFWKDTSESALLSKSADLWPLLTITPERLEHLHLSEPYLETERSMLVRADSSYRKLQDLATATVGLANPPLEGPILRALLPHARLLARQTPQSVIEDLCEQRTDSAFVDSYAAISVLIEKPACAGHSLRWIVVPQTRLRAGIASTFEAFAAADALRAEIGAMAREGQLAPIVAQWEFTPVQKLESMEELVDARRSATRLAAVAVLFALLLVLTCWQTVRITRERNRSRRTERALREVEQKLRLTANNLREMVLAYDMDRNLIYANPAAETLTGYSVADLQKTGFIDWVHPDDRPRMLGFWEKLFQGSSFQDEEYRLVAKDGRVKWAAASWGPLLDEAGRQVGVQGSERDISEHRALQEQYLQAQKMESIGRLAGGVAHDFNNLLTVINGYSDIVFRALDAQDPLRQSVDQIRKAGERAAGLTQHLLAFSRKQIAQPRPLDLNALVADSERMLRRVLGEDIELVVTLSPNLGLVMADPGHMHQILMNLVVNARDAMPDGGRLTIETAEVDLDAGYVAEHPSMTPGPHVLLAVTDTGIGMDEETTKHIFEPFFTTKGVGQGTGLGLATVYGIVKQSQGWIWVYSEPGKGTSFKIYQPRIDACTLPMEAAVPPKAPSRAFETVLVVEDQAEVRALTKQALESHGFRVFDAPDGAAALALVKSYTKPIHLVITDVVLPGMNGKELAEQLQRLRPGIKVLFTSGYPRDVIAHRGVLDPGLAYIGKPYSPDAIAAKVREVLGESTSP